MMHIDQVRLNFNPHALLALNLILALVMFGVALDLKLSDFRQALRTPKALAIGLFGHHILFPAGTFLLIRLIDPLPSIALGMLLVSSCPAGHISNFFTHRAGGNAALSVSISTLSTVAAIFMMPLNVAFWAGQDAGMRAIMHDFSLDPIAMLTEVGMLLGVPLVAGLLISHRMPRLAARMLKPMRIFSLGVFAVFVTGALLANWKFFLAYGAMVVGIVFVHNACALGSGYGLARLFGLAKRDCRAVAFETGIQNSGLGLVLIFNFFGGLGGMAIVTAWWGIWHIIAGMALSTYWMKKPLLAAKAGA
ncbi:MAG TPA: bile acid:sodium symporter family protein [Noviherbaspirillum sp.]|uniref:bile acid:sodium symporter family protein n=1 Tax=Noviherbaspirillum sp. TaxID=1926288 RepID=UPI002B483390|nr:bile acid:sodium symporter family protein [Noviherbaspirillum sp.]HJV84635.1 bile acid:sodium symporter family protein [Noviherbaspirillum sp.]